MIHERCGCGAEFTIDLRKSGTPKEELSAVTAWRDGHRHDAAAPGTTADDVVVTLVPPTSGAGAPARPEVVVPADALERLSGAAGQFLALMNKLSGPGQGRGDGF